MEAINSSQRNSQAPVPAAQTNATAPSLLSRFATTIERDPMLLFAAGFALESVILMAMGRPALAGGIALASLYFFSKTDAYAELFRN
jgi:hypothetical protein